MKQPTSSLRLLLIALVWNWSTAVLTLAVIPAIYALVKQWRLARDG